MKFNLRPIEATEVKQFKQDIQWRGPRENMVYWGESYNQTVSLVQEKCVYLLCGQSGRNKQDSTTLHLKTILIY